MGPIENKLESEMKKVSTLEKMVIIACVSVVGGTVSVLSKMTPAESLVNGIGFGVLGAIIIGLCHKARS